MKTCTECHVEKPETDFYKDYRSTTGRAEAKCKDCRNVRMKLVPDKKYEPVYDGYKTCQECGVSKQVSEFGINKAVKGGRKPACKSCEYLAINSERRENGPIFKPLVISELIPDHTDYKMGTCEVCYAQYPLVREADRHKRCDRCSKLVRGIHIDLGHKRNGKDIISDIEGPLVELAVNIARVHINQDTCIYCDTHFTDDNQKQIDHINPICLGGIHSLSNIAICCKRCNFSKGRYPLEQWISTCKLVAAYADINYVVPTTTIMIDDGVRHCSVCNADISGLHRLSIYCASCQKLIKRLSSSLTSSRGEDVSSKCPRHIVVKVAQRWTMATSCCYCGRSFSDDVVKSADHIVPICITKENQEDNLAISCLECNRSKRDLPLDMWVELCKRVAKHFSM